ncbi:MAG: TIGR04076 family protein [Clostridiales bacterium]|nr:TIGR04076 family protein [Clostridiales bacterium]
MAKVKLTVTHSECRSAYHKQGDCFVVEDLCPPICHELWNVIYPYVFALQNGGDLDCGDKKARTFFVRCPDGGRVAVRGELLREDEGSR